MEQHLSNLSDTGQRRSQTQEKESLHEKEERVLKWN